MHIPTRYGKLNQNSRRKLVHREALAPRTEVLMAGQSDPLQQLVDKQRLLLEPFLLFEDERTKPDDAARQFCRAAHRLVVTASLIHLQYPVVRQISIGPGDRQRIPVKQPVDLLCETHSRSPA